MSVLREVARELRQRQTPQEATKWKHLRGRRVAGAKFKRQVPLAGFIVDFYCAELCLSVELDGGIHDEQAQRDAERDAILTARGVTVVRIRNEDIDRDLLGVLHRLRTTVGLLLPSPVLGRGAGGEGTR
ncbi:MAG: DUF559 domain-containing protein [Deltaproteobacteria bacterium]|nr:DUF559 domain-containing protein [Deltaproteobacteria bacterium]